MVMPRRLSSRIKIADFPRSGWIDPGSRFVQDEKLRLLDEGLRETDALEHSLGVTSQPAIARIRQANQIEQLLDAASQPRPAQSAKFSIKAERFAAGQIFVEIRTLRQKTNSFAALDQTAVPAKNLGFAPGGGNEAKEDLQRRALAGSIWAQEPVDLAGGDFEVQVVDRHDRAPLERYGKNLRHADDGDSGLSHAESRSHGTPVDRRAALPTAS